MGTTSLAVPQVVEILGPNGSYETKKIALRTEYSPIVQAAKKIESIGTADEAEEVTKLGRLLQAGSKEFTTFFKGVKTTLDDLKKPVLADEKAEVGLLDGEKTRLGNLLTAYQAEERRKREEEERKAREEAQRIADEEALQRAIELAAAGEDEAAEAVLQEPVIAAPVIIQSSAPKPTGSVGRKTYSAEVVNLMELVKAVAAGTVPLLAIQANDSFIGNQARAMKDAFAMPGVKLKVSESTSFRA